MTKHIPIMKGLPDEYDVPINESFTILPARGTSGSYRAHRLAHATASDIERAIRRRRN
jgi:hypothetical protein